MKKFYAVRKGRTPGIYTSWDECKKQTTGFSGAEFKSFLTEQDAKDFINNKKTCESDIVSEVYAYVDGSFSQEKAMFSYGAVIFHDGEEKHYKKAMSDPELLSMRNVAGEIKGAEFVIRYCIDNNVKSVDIYHDYAGIEKWCTGEWKATKPGTKSYSEFYKEASQKVEINFVKVKGHAGIKYNELADKLAKQALGI